VRDVARLVPVDVERRRLVEPGDLVEVEQLCELPLGVMGKVDFEVREVCRGRFQSVRCSGCLGYG
jgi:hypothetical protein